MEPIAVCCVLTPCPTPGTLRPAGTLDPCSQYTSIQWARPRRQQCGVERCAGGASRERWTGRLLTYVNVDKATTKKHRQHLSLIHHFCSTSLSEIFPRVTWHMGLFWSLKRLNSVQLDTLQPAGACQLLLGTPHAAWQVTAATPSQVTRRQPGWHSEPKREPHLLLCPLLARTRLPPQKDPCQCSSRVCSSLLSGGL